MELSPEKLQKIEVISLKIQKILDDPRSARFNEEGKRHLVERACDLEIKTDPEVAQLKDAIIERFFPKTVDPLEKNRTVAEQFLTAIEQKMIGKTPDERDAHIKNIVLNSSSFQKAPLEVQGYLLDEFKIRGWIKDEMSTDGGIPLPPDNLDATRELLEDLKIYQFTIDRTKDFGIIGLVEQIFPDLSTRPDEEKNLIVQTVTHHYEQLLKSPEFKAENDRIQTLLTQQFEEWKNHLLGRRPARGGDGGDGKDKKEPTKRGTEWSLDDEGNIQFMLTDDSGEKVIPRRVDIDASLLDTPEKKEDLIAFLNKIERWFQRSLDSLQFDFDARKVKISYRTPEGIQVHEGNLFGKTDQIEALKKFQNKEPLLDEEKKTAFFLRKNIFFRLRDEVMSIIVKDYLEKKYRKVSPPPIKEPPPPPEEKKLDELRQAFIKAESAWKQFEGPIGALLGSLQGGKRAEIQARLDEARAEYEAARAEYVVANLENYLAEDELLLDERIVETLRQKEQLWGGRLLDFLDRHKSHRLWFSLALLGIGISLPVLGGGAGIIIAGVSVLTAQRILGGLSMWSGTEKLIRHWREGRDHKKIDALRVSVSKNPSELFSMEEEELLERIIQFRSFAITYGQSLEDDDLYKKLVARWKSLVLFERTADPITEEELRERSRETESMLEESRRKNKHTDDIARILGVTLGVSAGSGILAHGIAKGGGILKEGIIHLLGGKTASAAEAIQMAAMSGITVSPPVVGGSGVSGISPDTMQPIAASSASGTIEQTTNNLQTAQNLMDAKLTSFNTEHALLHESGITSSFRNGHIALEARIGDGEKFNYLDQLLRRMVVQEMDLVDKTTFNALDAARAENALANFRQLLKGHSVFGISPDAIKSFASFDGKTLTITDHETYQRFMKEKLLAHAEHVITPESGAVKEATKTSHAIWEQMLEVKNKDISVENFSVNETVDIRKPLEDSNIEPSKAASHADINQSSEGHGKKIIQPQSETTETPSHPLSGESGYEDGRPPAHKESDMEPEIGNMTMRELPEGGNDASPSVTQSPEGMSVEKMSDIFEKLQTNQVGQEQFNALAHAHPKEFSQFVLDYIKRAGISYITIDPGAEEEIFLNNDMLTNALSSNNKTENFKNIMDVLRLPRGNQYHINLILNGEEHAFRFSRY